MHIFHFMNNYFLIHRAFCIKKTSAEVYPSRTMLHWNIHENEYEYKTATYDYAKLVTIVNPRYSKINFFDYNEKISDKTSYKIYFYGESFFSYSLYHHVIYHHLLKHRFWNRFYDITMCRNDMKSLYIYLQKPHFWWSTENQEKTKAKKRDC
jgi:hypothetical protein